MTYESYSVLILCCFSVGFFLETSNTSCIIYVIKLGFSDLVLFSVFLVFSVRSRSLSPVRLSSVCRLLRSCTLLRRLKFSAMFLGQLIRRPSIDIKVNFYRDHPRGTPPSGELNTRGVAEYSDFVPIELYISETV